MVLPGRNPVVLAKELATPRPPVGRAAAAGVRPRRRRPARAAGVRRRARRAGEDLRRGAAAHAGGWAGGRRRPRRRRASTTRRCACCPSRASSRPTCGSAASPRRSCGASAAWPTAGCPSFVTPDDVRHRAEVIEQRRRARPRDRRRALRRADPLRQRPVPDVCSPRWPSAGPTSTTRRCSCPRHGRRSRRPIEVRRRRHDQVRRAPRRRARDGDARPPGGGCRRLLALQTDHACFEPDGDRSSPPSWPRSVGPGGLHGGPLARCSPGRWSRPSPTGADGRWPASPSSCSAPSPSSLSSCGPRSSAPAGA